VSIINTKSDFYILMITILTIVTLYLTFVRKQVALNFFYSIRTKNSITQQFTQILTREREKNTHIHTHTHTHVHTCKYTRIYGYHFLPIIT